MTYPVLIRMISTSDNGDGEPSSMSTMVPGKLTVKDGVHTLSYEEIIEDEGDGSVMSQQVELIVGSDSVEMRRLGDISTTMVFRKNYRFEGAYHTPFGDMSMSILTSRVAISTHDLGGSFELRYELDTQGTFAALLTMNATWTVQSSC